MPLVSAMMLSYDHEKFISEAIESVLDQDFDDLELIIVDDASTDSSRQVIQKYAAKDSRIRVILHEANCGIARTANDCIAAAKGKFLSFVASDDVWMKDKLSKQLAVLESNEDVIVWSEGEIIDQKGQPIGKSFSEYQGFVSQKKSGHIFQELAKNPYIFASTLLFKRANLGNIRFDKNLVYLNDYKFLLDLAQKYEFYYIAEPLAKYRVHGRNVLLGSSPDALKRRQIADREQASILEESIRQHDHELAPDTKANMYASLSRIYYYRGEKKKSLRFVLHALRCSPTYPLTHTLPYLLRSR